MNYLWLLLRYIVTQRLSHSIPVNYFSVMVVAKQPDNLSANRHLHIFLKFHFSWFLDKITFADKLIK